MQNNVDIKEVLLLRFISSLIKSRQVVVLLHSQIIKLDKIGVLSTWLRSNQLKNYANQFLENKIIKTTCLFHI